jgi:hypothetical protein
MELTEVLSGLNIGEQIYDSQFGMEMIQEMGIDVSDE